MLYAYITGPSERQRKSEKSSPPRNRRSDFPEAPPIPRPPTHDCRHALVAGITIAKADDTLVDVAATGAVSAAMLGGIAERSKARTATENYIQNYRQQLGTNDSGIARWVIEVDGETPELRWRNDPDIVGSPFLEPTPMYNSLAGANMQIGLWGDALTHTGTSPVLLLGAAMLLTLDYYDGITVANQTAAYRQMLDNIDAAQGRV